MNTNDNAEVTPNDNLKMKVVGCRLHSDDIDILDKEVLRKNERSGNYQKKTRSDLIQYALLQYIDHINARK